MKLARGLLAGAIPLLALAIGTLHFSLDYVLYHGYVFFSALSRLFALNFALFVIAAGLYLVLLGAPLLARVLMDVLLFFLAADTLLGWLVVSRPNPRGLGHLAAALEVALILASVGHALLLERGAGLVLARRKRA